MNNIIKRPITNNPCRMQKQKASSDSLEHLSRIARLPVFALLALLSPLSAGAQESAQPGQKCQAENISATTPSDRFQVHNNQTVTDTQTGLLWSQCLLGASGTECSQGEPLALTWAQALVKVPQENADKTLAGYNDWRIPNIRELSTLAELQCVNPAMNVTVFPNTPSSHVWSSSPYHFYTHYSWYVDFTNGTATYDERIRPKMLRLVREAQ